MEKEDEKKDNKIRCSKCGSLFGYLKSKENIWRCRSCGNEDKEVIA